MSEALLSLLKKKKVRTEETFLKYFLNNTLKQIRPVIIFRVMTFKKKIEKQRASQKEFLTI